MHKKLIQNMIPVSGPSITSKEIKYVTDAVTNAWYTNANIYNERFEKAFADYIGVKYALSLPSCTSAIHLSLLSLDIGSGDEVIIPDATWIATAAPITYVGAKPVFADIDPNTWCLSADSLKQYLTDRTKAIIPVDLYGNVPDWDALLNIADKSGLAVIEDAAEAVGSEYKGRKAGSFGDTGVFSFHGSKTMVTGEGGMLVTSNEDILKKALALRDHGREPGDTMFFNKMVGFKYKMSSLQAALGLAQLERIDELIRKKRKIFEWYRKRLDKIEGLQYNYEAPGTKNSYWMVTVITNPELNINKEKLIAFMAERYISCRPFFFPLSMTPAFKKTNEANIAKKRNNVSYSLSPHGINLPSGMNMDEELVDRVCTALKDAISDLQMSN